MPVVIVSPKYQVVIPREVRESLGIRPGEEVQVFQYDGRIEMIPLKNMKKMRGMLKGVKATFEHEQDRL